MFKPLLELNDELGVLLGDKKLVSFPVKDLDKGFDVSINGECTFCWKDYDGKHEKHCQYKEEIEADSLD